MKRNIRIGSLIFLLWSLGLQGFATEPQTDPIQKQQDYYQGLLCAETENWDSAKIYFEDAIVFFESARDWPAWIAAVLEWSVCLSETGQEPLAIPRLRVAVDRARRMRGALAADQLAQLYFNLGWSYYAVKGQMDSTTHFFKLAIETREQPEAQNIKHLIEYHNDFSYILWRRGRFKLALKQAKIALQLGENETDLEPEKHAYSFHLAATIQSELGQFHHAIDNFGNAIAIMDTMSEDKGKEISVIYNNIATVWSKLGEEEKALEIHRKNLALRQEIFPSNSRQVCFSLMNLGSAYGNTGEFEKGIQHLETAISIMEKEGNGRNILGNCYAEIAGIYSDLGDFRRSLQYGQLALETRIRENGPQHPKVANIRNNLGIDYWKMGDAAKALDQHFLCLEILEKVLPPGHPRIAISYNNIATAYLDLGKVDDAAIYAKKAANLRKKIWGPNHFQVANSYNNLGAIFKKNKDYETAIHYFELAHQANTRSPGHNQLHIGLNLYNLAGAVLELGNYVQAREYAVAALKVRKDELGDRHPDVARSFALMGQIHFRRGQYREAAHHFRLALAAVAPDFDPNNFSNEMLAKVSDKKLLVDILHHQAVNSWEAGVAELDSLAPLQQALVSCQQAISIIDAIRMDYSKPARFQLDQDFDGVYETGMQAAFRLLERTGEMRYLEAAWEIAEKNKTNYMRAYLHQMRVNKFAGIPDSLQNLERELQMRAAYYQENLARAQFKASPEETVITRSRRKGIAVRARIDSLLQTFRTNYPRYHQLKFNTRVVSTSEVREQLPDEHIAMVTYYFGQEKVYVFGIAKGQVARHAFDLDDHFVACLDTFLADLQSENEIMEGGPGYDLFLQRYSRNARALYHHLLAPVLTELPPSLNRLILVPDGPLTHLPFETLLTGPDTPNQPMGMLQMPYLIADYTTMYAWSATVHFAQPYAQPRAREGKFVAFAPPYSLWPNARTNLADSTLASAAKRSIQAADSKTYANLPIALVHAQREVAALGETYGATVVADVHATEEKLLKLFPETRILHLSAHGLLNEDQPEDSHILLMPPQKAQGHLEGKLHMSEIFNSPIQAELVVVSVCNSIRGKNQFGEGIQSLARAFAYSGCPGIVASQWSINDEASMQVILRFYRNLARGMGKASALREAKLYRLKNGGIIKAHPYFWAGMVLVGDDAKVTLHYKSAGNRWAKGLWLTLLIALLSLSLLSWKVNRTFRKRHAGVT